MDYITLQDEVEILVDDPSEEILGRIPSVVNEAISYIANEPSLILPSLKSIHTAETIPGQAWVTLPTQGTGKIMHCTAHRVPCRISNVLEDLLKSYPSLDSEGDVVDVALEGSVLWYQGIPTMATPLLILYYKSPVELVFDADIPADIPPHLHRETIVRKAASILYDFIEDGEEKKFNTLVQDGFYERGKDKLLAFLASRRRGQGTSVWSI